MMDSDTSVKSLSGQQPAPGSATQDWNNNDDTTDNLFPDNFSVFSRRPSIKESNSTEVFIKGEKNGGIMEKVNYGVINPFAMARMKLCKTTLALSYKKDIAEMERKERKHKQFMLAAEKESKKLAAEISAEEERIKFLTRNADAVKEKNAMMACQIKKLKDEAVELINDVTELQCKITFHAESNSVGNAILRLLNVDPMTLNCPEGKKTVGNGSESPECDILQCPAAPWNKQPKL